MMDAGADIMYAERSSVAVAAVERGVKGIGNVIDTWCDYPDTIQSSALWQIEPTIDRAIAVVAGGTFESVDFGRCSFMTYGGGSLVLDENRVPDDVLSKVKETEEEILTGMCRINVNDAQPVSDK